MQESSLRVDDRRRGWQGYQFTAFLGGSVLLALAFLLAWPGLLKQITSTKFLPHSFCYLQNPALVWTHVLADCAIGLAYVAISSALGYLVYRAHRDIPFHWMFVAFGAFIIACGTTHFIEALTVWVPVYVLAAIIKVLTAVVSLATALALPWLIPRILGLIRQAKASDSAMAMLREADLRIRAITTTAPDAIISTNAAGEIRYVNPAAEALFGYTAEQLSALNVVALVPERLRGAYTDQLKQVVQRRFRGVIRTSAETVALTRNGQEIPVSISVSCWESDGGVCFTSVVQDLRARRNAEIKFEALLESAPDAMVIVDEQSGIVLVNSQTERVFGWSRGELLGKSIEALMPARFQSQHLSHRAGFMRDPRSRPMGIGLQLFGLRKNGEEFPVEISLSPLKTPDGVYVTAAIRDITDRKRAEEEIRTLNSELKLRVAELASSNRELESFSYSVSHDLRAPLRQIDGYSKILMRSADHLTADEQSCLHEIRSGTRHMADLIDALLNFSRLGKQEIRREAVDLNILVRQIELEFSRETLTRTIHWKFGYLPVVNGDRALLRQVVWNLLSNAVKFTRTRTEATIEVGTHEKNGKYVIFVRDNGVGFDMKYAVKLFGVFQRFHLQEEFEGTGVGLANVQRIIHKHGGSVWAEATPDKGATFYFTLDPSLDMAAQESVL